MSVRWQHIRTTAAAVRHQFAERSTAPTTLPIALDELVECLWDLTVVRTNTLAADVFGKVEPEREVIRVRRDLPPVRQRFVIAHEVGHVALEGLAAGPFQDTDDTLDERAAGESADESAVRTYNTRERHEQEANLFALELLIPADELWHAIQQPDWNIADLSAHFGVSLDAIRTQLVNVCCIEPLMLALAHHSASGTLLPPDPEQQKAVDAKLPLLLAAGPGTGKTRSIVAKYIALVRQGVDPATILALTFSNKAADEMRGRIVAALRRERPELAGRVDINTFHAWGLNVLRAYGPRIELTLDVRLRDTGDLFLLLTRHLADLQLDHLKDLHNPSHHVLAIMKAISRIKDELRTPAEFALLAEAEAQRLIQQANHEHPGTSKTASDARQRAANKAAALRELAQVYPRYEDLLRRTGTLDYGDLIVLAVAVLGDPVVAAELRAQYHYMLVDEFQDINYASGELLRLLDGGRGRVWAVGDAWQSIYRFRGASAANLDEFAQRFPAAGTLHLTRNYRSLQPILDASQAMMLPDPRAPERPVLNAKRGAGMGTRVVEWVAPARQDEYAAIAHDILRRVGKRAHATQPCVRVDRRPSPARRIPRRRLYVRRTPPPLLVFRGWRFRDHAVLCRKNEHAEQVAAMLERHGIPVDSVRDVFQTAEVKDALAICAQVRALNSAGLLRALTMADHQLDPADVNMLVQQARQTNQSLPRAARDPAIVTQLSPAAQHALTDLHTLLEALAHEGDAWQVLTTYLFHHSPAHRERLIRAATTMEQRSASWRTWAGCLRRRGATCARHHPTSAAPLRSSTIFEPCAPLTRPPSSRSPATPTWCVS
jgi:ATP-dependent DNA helicase UvrD/PcrA